MSTPAPVQQKRFENEKAKLDGCFSPPNEKCLERQPRPAPDSGPAAPKGRLASLDAFRGLTIALMILVNSPGDY